MYNVTELRVGDTLVACLAEQNGTVNSTVAAAVLHVLSAEEGENLHDQVRSFS